MTKRRGERREGRGERGERREGSGCNIEAGGLITGQCSLQITIRTLFSDSSFGMIVIIITNSLGQIGDKKG